MKIECEVQVYCAKCSNVLDAVCVVDYKDQSSLKVAPCETCLNEAKDAGYHEAQNDAN